MKGRFLIYSLLVILIDSGYMKDKSYSYKILLFSFYIKGRNNSDKKTLWKVLKKHMKNTKIFLKKKKTKGEERPDTDIKTFLKKKKKESSVSLWT